jgi:hypothetical protein
MQCVLAITIDYRAKGGSNSSGGHEITMAGFCEGMLEIDAAVHCDISVPVRDYFYAD